MEYAKWLLVLTGITAPLLVPSPLEQQGGFKALSEFYTVTCLSIKAALLQSDKECRDQCSDLFQTQMRSPQS